MLDTIRRIIVPIDFSTLSGPTVESAAFMALPDDAIVHLLHVVHLPFFLTAYDLNVPESVWEEMRKETRERMYESSLTLEEAGLSEVDLIVRESTQPAEAIAEAVRELGADLVVMATHGRRGLKHAFLGSVTEKTIRTSPCPVLAVKGDGLAKGKLQRILFPTDFSPHSRHAMALACGLARRYGAHIDVLHVVEDRSIYTVLGSTEAVAYEHRARAMAGERLEETINEMGRSNQDMESHLRKGIAADVIVDEARRLESDLIVMGSHGYSGLAHAMIGSVTERTLRLAPCSVLTSKAIPDTAAASG